jgi:hypothetical protein
LLQHHLPVVRPIVSFDPIFTDEVSDLLKASFLSELQLFPNADPKIRMIWF